MEKKQYRNILLFIVFSGLTCTEWLLFLTAENSQQQKFALSSTLTILAVTVFLIFIFKKRRLPSPILKFLLIPIISAFFLILLYLWNSIFISSNEVHEYSGNIFRGAFNGFISPLYGKVYPGRNFDFFQEIILILFVGLSFYYLLNKERSRNKVYIVSFFTFIVIILFSAFHTSIYETFLSNNCHYLSFKSDNSKFSSFSDILRNYSSRMSGMSIHNNHYPPGNVMLSYLDEKVLPFSLKSITFLSLLTSLVPFIFILDFYRTKYTNLIFAIFLYITSGSILFFHGIALSPIVTPISLFLVYFLIKGLKNNDYKSPILFGVLLALYSFISFTSLTFVLFCIILVIGYLFKEQGKIKNVLQFLILSLTVFVISFSVLYLASGFNILECFFTSLANEKTQMDYASRTIDVTRYFIVSTGNLISFLINLGPIVLSLFFISIFKSDNIKFKNMSYALLLVVLIFAFSNHFYLEVERIWIFITPFFILFSSNIPALNNKDHKILLATLIVANIFISLWLMNVIEFCGFFT